MSLLRFSRRYLSLENACSHKFVIVQDTGTLIPIVAATGKDVTRQRGETVSGPIDQESTTTSDTNTFTAARIVSTKPVKPQYR